MRLKIAPNGVQCSYHPLSFVSPKPNSSIVSFSFKKQSKRDQTLVCQIFLSSSFTPRKLLRSQTFDKPVSRGRTIKPFCGANLEEVFNEESSEDIEELAQRFDLSDNEENDQEEHMNNTTTCTMSETSLSSSYASDMYCRNSFLPSKLDFLEPIRLGIKPEPPEWPEREAVIRASIERKANSFDLPLSLRMIKKKQQWPEGFRGESASCSVKKAFSSMVFIILELQSYALQMREVLCYEDLEVIINKVQREMHASYVWLFRQVFSRTPILMTYVMILLANFSVYSMDHNVAMAEPSTTEMVSVTDDQNQQYTQFDSSAIGLSSVPGNNGGNKHYLSRPSQSIPYPDDVVAEEISRVGNKELSSSVEASLWNSMVDEATKMQAGLRGVVLGHEAMQCFVSPVSVELEPDDYTDYFRTDLLYQMGLYQEPNNSLLLSNYAQFLYLVAHDHDRAEECFKRAVQVEPPDAESVSQYANFLWVVRKDLWGAEERYLQAIAAEPDNPYHASKYANFLWSTGGEETCFPLNTSSNNSKASNL